MAWQRKYRSPKSRRHWGKTFWIGAAVVLAVAVIWIEGPGTSGSRHGSGPPQSRKSPTGKPAGRPLPGSSILSEVGVDSSPFVPRPVRNPLEAQIALDRLGLSPGSIDGRIGPQTQAALRAFQQSRGLPVTGELDGETGLRLTLSCAPFGTYAVASNDLGHLQPLAGTWLGKSQQTALNYETILELVAERSHASPNLIRLLNPAVDWTNVEAGAVLRVPALAEVAPPAKAAFGRISLSGKILEIFDMETNLLGHFPCSIARRVEKRPVGELHVAVIAPNPNYTFDPDLFPESAEAQELKRKLVLPPGPNNPVGTAWIGLDRPGYGIHGTPSPELVGRTESHGCFRLANWNAELLLKSVWIGMPVWVEP